MAGKTVIVIGSGFAGLSAASFMAKAGWKVILIEKHKTPGGRARQLKDKGYSFDMGPSFYWMPDVFERYFKQFGKKVSDYYSLARLDPSYRVYWNDGFTDMPANMSAIEKEFESIEAGSSKKLSSYLREAKYKYDVGINKLVYKPGLSVLEFMDWSTIKGMFRLDVFISIKKHIHKYFKHPKLRQIMEFPVLFLGALPEDTPALYSLMNYADLVGGTWYPKKGMYSVVEGMHKLALESGVEFRFEEEVTAIDINDATAKSVTTDKGVHHADAVISAADYHFTETKLLEANYRNYSDKYWEKKTMAPSCLLFYVGLNKKLKQKIHHSLFFDVSFEEHGKEIYKKIQWPTQPLFYMSVSSLTDQRAAPAGHEALVFLIPVASGLEGDTEELRKKYFTMIAKRMEKHTGESILDSIDYFKSYSVSDFVYDYNSYRGNAYGLANTLRQTAIFRPACRNKKVKNLFYTGQLTVTGPGVPPSLISGEVVSRLVNSKIR
jgi:phytoene desaturase